MLKVQAPAKINLTLEVLGKRPDGYHEIRSVLQKITLCDTLSFQPSGHVSFSSDAPAWSAEKSLLPRAVRLAQEAAGVSRGVAIGIEKRIPMLAGLGGDSSDAAAVLRGLNELWELNLSPRKLRETAAQLGSDVTFFLNGGTALAEGRGEKITPLQSPPRMWVVIAVPDLPREPGKTARMYAALKPSHYTGGAMTDNFVKFLKKGGKISPARLFNTFENVAFDLTPGLKTLKGHFTKLGAQDVHLAGSGPALYTVLADRALAGDLYARCKTQRIETCLAETI